MDNKYIKTKRNILWRFFIVLIILILTGLLIFQLYSKTSKDKPSDQLPVEYVEISYEDLTSKVIDKKDCFICGNPERSLMPYYRKFDTLGIISLNDLYVIDLGLKAYDETGKEMSNGNGTSIHSTNLDTMEYTLTSTASRGMADIEIILKENSRLDTKNLEKNLCSACLSKVTAVLEHSYRKGEEKEETIPLCLIDFDTLKVYSIQDFYRGYFVRDYWVEFEFTDEKIEVSAYYLPVRE